jgi:hypothetical protein
MAHTGPGIARLFSELLIDRQERLYIAIMGVTMK